MAGRIRKKSACPKMDSPEIAVADDVIHRTWRLPQPPKAASHNCPFRSGTLPVMKLPWVVAALVLTALSFGVPAQVASTTYWLLLKQDGHTWCGYADMAEFTSDVKNRTPTESARATYASDKLIEVTYQVAPESGDWVVVDKYTPANDQLILRRANSLAQDNLRIIEETSIHGGRVEPFHILSTTTLDGTKAEAPSNIDLPSVSVITDLSKTAFLTVVAEMRRQSISKLCRARG